MITKTKFSNPEVSSKFSSYPPEVKERLIELREIILNVASKNKEVGTINECLKWNEPSFLTTESKSGSAIRIDWKHKDPERYHIYFNCQTKLISIFKELFPNDFEFGGNRSISFNLNDKLPKRKISKCIEIALTYNSRNYKDFFDS